MALFTFVFTQEHFLLDIEDTGESTLFIFQDTINSLEPGDELGLFDMNGITADGMMGELLVGSGIWDGSQLNITTIASQDLTQFGGFILPGYTPGNNMVLNTYTNTIKNTKDHRWRIEHAQMIRSSDIPLFSKYGIVPSMQPTHCTSDMPWINDRIGKHRIHRISRWKTFINSGCKISGGSDCPIEDGNPLFEYYAAITRKNHKGQPSEGWEPQECLNRLDALKMFTTWAAYGEFSEHRRGRIRPGFDADLTILSDDIITCHPNKILEIDILGTIVSGDFVYSKI